MSISPQKYRVVSKKLARFGFFFKRNTGSSHEIWWNEKLRKTCVVPHHKEIKSGTMKSILNQAGISEEEFKKI